MQNTASASVGAAAPRHVGIDAEAETAWLPRALWGALLGLIGVYTLVVTGLKGFTLLPGDLGDARFNEFVLEHFYRFVTFQEASYWSPEIFYPYESVLGFSSSHLGDAPVYALFRLVGFERDLAFQLWYVAGYLTSFIAAWYALSRAKFGPGAVAIAAFIFAFGLPALAQQNHAQLIWRAGMPLACWWMWRFLQTAQPRMLFLATLAAVWQFYAEIYMGVMLGMFLLALIIAASFTFPGALRGVVPYWRQLGVRSWSRGWMWYLGIIPLVVAAILQVWPYLHVVRHYGFSRDTGEVLTMLPQLRSWLLNDQSALWAPVASRIDSLPMRWEHQLFIGVGAAIAVAAAFFLRPPPPSHRMVRANRIALVMIGVFTLHFHNLSLYELALHLPGLSALRGVGRIILILLWPISVLVAATLTGWLARKTPWRVVLAACVALLIVFESTTSRQYGVPVADAKARLASTKAAIAAAPASPAGPPIIFLARGKDGDPMLYDLDAILAAQDLGLATLNGYSGNTPPGYIPGDTCTDAIRRIDAYIAYEKPPGESVREDLLNRIQPAGFADCPANWRGDPDLRPRSAN